MHECEKVNFHKVTESRLAIEFQNIVKEITPQKMSVFSLRLRQCDP